ncbi:MAG: hypothetical protein AAB354_10160 [candidate division KSB1 bacterium]
MQILKWLIVVLALTEAGWMAFDGVRALIVGDYVTPKNGEYAGQLGPWAKIVSAIGIAPRSTLMKTIFVLYGVAWLMIIVAFTRDASWATAAMLLAALGSLWYLWVGTMTSAIIVVLMLLRKLF